jgi:hypothetical protein
LDLQKYKIKKVWLWTSKRKQLYLLSMIRI